MKNAFICFLFFFMIYAFGLNKLHSQTEKQSLIKNPPTLTEYVTDETGTLTAEQLATLRKKLKTFRDSTSTQIVVYMVNTINDEPIEEVSYAIADKNKIGRKGYNNGVLLLISKNDKKLRIEVGYGLEGALTDALSKQISREEITPYFKSNDFYTGIDKGINAIVSAVKGEYHLNVKNEESPNKKSDNSDVWIIILVVGIVVGLPVLIVILAIVRARRGLTGGTGTSGRTYTNDRYYSSGYSDSSSSDSSSSSSSDDDSFSGDGGSFGGGGASDDW